MAPFSTLCQDECPLVTGAFIALQRDVRAAGLGEQGGVHGDHRGPWARHPGPARRLLKEFGADWVLATGTPANLDALWKFLGVSVQIVPEEQPAKIDWYTGTPLTYDVDHTDGYFLIDASRPRALQRFESAESARAPRPEADQSAQRRRGAESRPPGQSQLDTVRCAQFHQLAGGSEHPGGRQHLMAPDRVRRTIWEHGCRDRKAW